MTCVRHISNINTGRDGMCGHWVTVVNKVGGIKIPGLFQSDRLIASKGWYLSTSNLRLIWNQSQVCVIYQFLTASKDIPDFLLFEFPSFCLYFIIFPKLFEKYQGNCCYICLSIRPSECTSGHLLCVPFLGTVNVLKFWSLVACQKGPD